MELSDPIEAMIPVVAELERLGVRYYVVGSMASTTYGHMRTTQDVDLVADLAPEHAAALAEALQDTYYVSRSAISDAIARKSCFNLVHSATSFKVDVFAPKGRPYDRVAMQRARKEWFDEENPSAQFFVASAEDVILGKLEWFRLGDEISERQWDDVTNVLKVQQNSIDRLYLQHWAAELGIADLLEKAWRELETEADLRLLLTRSCLPA